MPIPVLGATLNPLLSLNLAPTRVQQLPAVTVTAQRPKWPWIVAAVLVVLLLSK